VSVSTSKKPIRQRRWTQAEIARVKQQVKIELDGPTHDQNSAKRLRKALDHIAALADQHAPLAHLRRYVYVMSALVHHERHGGLSKSQIMRLGELAESLLKVQGIGRGRGKSASLYGELHLILSQIYRQSGRQWEATWEQEISHDLVKRQSSSDHAFALYACGMRSLRLGHVSLALQQLEHAEELGLAAPVKGRILFEKARAWRIAGDLTQALACVSDSSRSIPPDDRAHIELEWELLCCKIQMDHDLKPMLTAIRRGMPHHQASFVVEAKLWSMCVPEKRWRQKLPKLHSLTYRSGLPTQGLGFFVKCVQTLEACYDVSAPLTARVKRLGQVLGQLNQLLRVDQELLVWAASTRWLRRVQATNFAALTLAEYQSLSWRLSQGKHQDCLGLVGENTGNIDYHDDLDQSA